MNDTVSLANVQAVLNRAGWGDAIVDDRSSLERLHVIVAELFSALSEALQDDTTIPTVRHGRSRLTRRPIVNSKPTAPTSAISEKRSGLARWQTARVMAHIDSHLDSTIYTKELAALARLSSFHFCRVFRETFGAPPHRYVMQKRVTRAQDMMLRTSAPLGRIAMDCGMADQAHFNKLFRRFIGESPGAWRRARVSEMRLDSCQANE
jgi:AraC family transcriptional regulator